MAIEPKKKPCKGTHKDTKGMGCGEPQILRRLGLGTKCGCYAKFLYSTEAGKNRVNRAQLKATKIRRDFEAFTEEEEERKSLNWLLINTRNACHEYIRLRDKDKPCVSCMQPYNSSHQAGHFYKAEVFSNLRFDETNVHGQCPKCNIYKEGNESEYRVNIVRRIGADGLKRLDMLALKYKQEGFKWDRETLILTRTYYLDKIKELKRESGG